VTCLSKNCNKFEYFELISITDFKDILSRQNQIVRQSLNEFSDLEPPEYITTIGNKQLQTTGLRGANKIISSSTVLKKLNY
jgi:hypothetical protein